MRIDRKLFIEVFRNQASTRNRYAQKKFALWLLSKCKSFDRTCVHEFDAEGNLYITKGQSEIYPCIVAHLDQVHQMVDDYSIILHQDYAFAMDNTLMRQTGIGGDDKSGCFIALEMFKRFDNIKLVFFVDEECGGIGSDKANLEFFSDCSFVIQPDRNHVKNDYINATNGIQVTSQEFDEAMSSILKAHNYKKATGTFTDIGVLKENGLDICAFNIACGYFFAHTAEEVVHIPSLELCMDVIYEAIDQLSYRRWEHIAEFKSNRWGGGYGWYDWDDVFDDKGLEEEMIDTNGCETFEDYVQAAMCTCKKGWCDAKNFDTDLDGSIYCFGCNDYIKEPDNKVYGEFDK